MLDVSVTDFINAPPPRIRAIMFERQDPAWMAGTQSLVPLNEPCTGTRVQRTGRVLGRTLRWTTEVTRIALERLDLAIVEGPMRGTISYLIHPAGAGADVTIRHVVSVDATAPRWFLAFAIRRMAAADLRRLKAAAVARR